MEPSPAHWYSGLQGLLQTSLRQQKETQSVRVEGATSGSVTITGLQGGVQYQFQVVALGLQGGEEFEGARSVLDCNSMTTTGCNCSSSDVTAAG